MSIFKIDQKSTQLIILFLATFIFIVPQVSQQLFNDHLPITGDLVHRRAVYLLTNFPNLENPTALISSHSQFYHHFVSYFNILTGLTENFAFYGVSIVGFLMLFLGGLTILIFARRINSHWAFIAPLLFLNNTNLVLPFFGHTDQHLIYVAFGLFLFIILNFPSNIFMMITTILLLGITLNSSITIWLLLAITLLILEIYYKSYKPLLLCVIALILYLPFLTPPISYLVLNDSSGTLKSLPIFLEIFLAGIIFLLITYEFIKRFPRNGRRILLGVGIFVSILFFVIARNTGPFSGNVSPQQIESQKTAIRSANILNYIFVVNPNKGFAGFEIYIPLLFIIFLVGIAGLYNLEKTHQIKNIQRFYFWRYKIPIQSKILFLIFVISIGLILLRLFLLMISYGYFAKSPLYQLHNGRIMSVAFYLFPLILIKFIPALKSCVKKFGLISIMAVLIMNMVFISYFSAKRMNRNFKQQNYQQMIQTSLENGTEGSLSPPEGLYACQFYNHCDKKFTGGGF